MELYGSLLNISGSVTASTFTGSFIGDGSGLTGIQASGVTGLNLSQISSGNATASISTTGFTVNKNTQIQGNLSVTGALIANEYIVSSSVVYMTTSFASGSSAFGNDNNDVHQFTGSVQITGSISLNGQAIGTGKLDETTFQAYTSSNDTRVSSLETSSGSLNSFTSSINTTIKSKLDNDGVISGSVQVNITGTTGYSTFSSSIATTTSGLTSTITSLSSSLTTSIGALSSSIATTDLNQENRLNALETSSGSLNGFTSSIDTTIKTKLNADGVLSGSSQILNGSNLVSSSAQVTAYGFATTGSNLFKGTQTHSGSILPSVDNTYDLGSADYQWRDVYISSGSLYIDGTKVLSSTAQELTITTDNGQSLKILEGTTDSIILQTADGDIELKSSADGDILLDPTNGKIMLKGPVEILNGQKIQSSVGGTPVVFANDIVVSGSIDITGTIEGINLTDFSSSVNTRLGGIETATGSLNSYTSSNTTNINAIHTSTSSLNTFTSSINTTIKSKLDGDGVISGSVQVVLTGTTGYSAFSSSVSASIGEISGSIATTTSGLSSSIGSLSSSVATTTSGLTSTITSLSSSVNSSIGSLSSSVATTTSGLTSTITSLSSSVATTTSGLSTTITNLSSSIATTTLNQSGRLDSIEGKTGSYATTGSNVFQGDQTITGSLYVSQNLIIAGSSSIQHISSSVVNIADNIITVNAQNPSVRFGGIGVIDSGSSPQVSGSLLFDATENEWIFVHQDQTAVTSALLIMGPETYNDIGNEIHLTNNRLVKSTNDEHVGDSNISDNGTTVTILSNTVINGTITSTGTTIVSGSSQISHDSTTGYVANRHIDHTAVTITAGNGLSGGGDISSTRTVTLDTGSVHFLDGVKKELNTEGVISGSSQVLNGSGVWSGSAQLPSGVVSGSSQVLAGTGIWSGSAQLPSGVVSGSSQISFGSITGVPSGLVSGSSQVLAGTTIHSGAFFNGISVVSGSAQISFNGIIDKPTLVSGSSQISFGSITGVPGGLVSGSSQIDLTATTNYSTGIKTRLNAEGVLSGSAQVVAALPSGTVSGSAQITLSSTTGYGSVLNQAVLTTSSPTFSAVSATTFTGALSGNASTASSTPTLSASGALTTQAGSGTLIHTYALTAGQTGLFSTSDNSNSIITFNRHPGDYYSQLGFNSTGTIFYRSFNATAINTSQAWKTIIDSSNIGSQSVTYATTAGALTSMNISQFTNNSGYITGISFANVSSKPTTISGYGITDAITTSNISSQTVASAGNSTTVGGLTPIQFFNNMGDNHSTRTSFDASTPSYGFGFRYVQGNTNGPATGGGGQFYSWYMGLGNDYPATGGGSYGMYVAIPRTATTPYMSVRYNESNSLGSWIKIAAGYADTAGSVSGANVSGNISGNASNITSYTINQSVGTSNTVQFASLGVGVSPALTVHFRGSNEMVRFENTSTSSGQYCQLNMRAGNRNAYLWIGNENSSSWAGAGGLNIYTENGNIDLWSNAVQRIRLQTDGHLVPYVNNSYDLGSASLGWRNVYTNDLHLSNMNKPEGNDVDGTNGNWTIQEGAENLYIINNNNGKKFKISLEEII